MDTGVAFGKVFATAVDDLGLLMIFLLVGVLALRVCKPLKKLYLPAGLIGGAVALIMGPQVLGIIEIPSTWSGMATPMICRCHRSCIFNIFCTDAGRNSGWHRA